MILKFSRSLLALGREGGEKAARLTLEALGENRDEGRSQGWKRAEQVLGFGFVDRVRLSSMIPLVLILTDLGELYISLSLAGSLCLLVSPQPPLPRSSPALNNPLCPLQENVLSSWTTLDDFVLGFNAFSTSKVGGLAIVDLPNADCPSKLASASFSPLCVEYKPAV